MKLIKFTFPIFAIATLTACDPSLPKCDAEETTKLVNQIIGRYAGKGYFSIKNMKEKDYNKEREARLCEATLIGGKGTHNFTYSVSWQDKKNSMFWVQIVE